MIEEDSVEIIYEHESQISCMDFSEDERILGFGDIDGKGVMLLHEEYEVVLWIEVPNQKVNVIKYSQKTANFIFGFDFSLKIYSTKGKIPFTSFNLTLGIELMSLELLQNQGSLINIF